MKIVIVGAAGNVGSRTVDEALNAGHEVVAYVRRPAAVPPRPGLTIAEGDASDPVALAASAQDADAVIVSITGSMKDTSFMQRTLPEIIDGVKQARAKRLVLVSAFGAGDTADKASGFARLLYRTALRKFFDDKAASDALLTDSGLDYTIVYPVNLKDAPAVPNAAVKRLTEVRRVPGLPTLPFGNVAQALVQITEDASLSEARVLVTTAAGWKPVV